MSWHATHPGVVLTANADKFRRGITAVMWRQIDFIRDSRPPGPPPMPPKHKDDDRTYLQRVHNWIDFIRDEYSDFTYDELYRLITAYDPCSLHMKAIIWHSQSRYCVLRNGKRPARSFRWWQLRRWFS